MIEKHEIFRAPLKNIGDKAEWFKLFDEFMKSRSRRLLMMITGIDIKADDYELRTFIDDKTREFVIVIYSIQQIVVGTMCYVSSQWIP